MEEHQRSLRDRSANFKDDLNSLKQNCHINNLSKQIDVTEVFTGERIQINEDSVSESTNWKEPQDRGVDEIESASEIQYLNFKDFKNMPKPTLN